MAERIEIGFKNGVRDALGEKIRRRIREHLLLDVAEVKTAEVYTIDGTLSPDELLAAAQGPLSDPVIQNYTINRGILTGFDWMIEVGYRPGVTDNVGKTAREALALLFGKSPKAFFPVHTSRQYAIRGNLRREEAEKIATDLLANELIERFVIVDGRDWQPDQDVPAYVPRVEGVDHPRTTRIDLNVSDECLLAISSEGVLALNLEEMKTIQIGRAHV